jgi:hypothetical protein
MTTDCRVLLVAARFTGASFWNFREPCELYGRKYPAPPLGLITVAALLPPSWECRLIDRNAEALQDADLDWADLVMTGGMLPQRFDVLRVIEQAHARGKPVVVGGPDVTSSPRDYNAADFRVLGEAEGIIDAFVAAWHAGARRGDFEAEKFTADVTRTPAARFDLLKRSNYIYYGVQFARGCPFTCEFCDIIELYGRVPRVKTTEQMLTELEALYALGYRGHVDFVDDNFIGNKKAVKVFLPHLIEWQKERGFPFEFSTEASINLADDDALLELMRQANFFTVFVGIESPDTDTLNLMQKKQNTRRSLVASIHKITRAGMFVNAGFIIGFDSEKGSVAGPMIDCIEATAIPFCMVGLLFALGGTQLTRRLAREGRLFAPDEWLPRLIKADKGDQSVGGLNFVTARPRREILKDYRTVLASVYRPQAYYRRVRTAARLLNRPVLDRSRRRGPPPRSVFGVPRRDLHMLGRLLWRIATRHPETLWSFCKAFVETAWRNPRALPAVGMLAAFYLHLRPFSQYVVAEMDRQIDEIERGIWQPPPLVREDGHPLHDAPRLGRHQAAA